MKLSDALQFLRAQVEDHEAEWMVKEAYFQTTQKQIGTVELFTQEILAFPDGFLRLLHDWANRRRAGEPLQYLFKNAEFLGNRYEVGPGVLIPRPETEGLVLEAIQVLKNQGTEPLKGLEVGAGTGVISIELLLAFSALQMTATEASSEALAYGMRNAETHLKIKDRLRFVFRQDSTLILEGLENEGPFDFLISNPPYLQSASEATPEVERHEPHCALYSPGDPLRFYRGFASGVRGLLRPGAWVFFEVPHERAPQVLDLFRNAGFSELRLVKDLTSRDRILVGQIG